MVSSKLVIKTITRTSLFFDKFSYRIRIEGVPSSNWVHQCSTIEKYVEMIDDKYKVWDETKQRYPSGWYNGPPRSSDINLVMVDNLIQLIQIYSDKSQIKYRHENNTINMYTNELAIAEEFAKKLSIGSITHVTTSPDGIMFFKRTPPAKYRAYMTNNKMPHDFKEELFDYLERTPDVVPSGALLNYLTRLNRFNHQPMLWDKYYVDFNDDKNLMMMNLIFPNMIGKKYKLKQK